MAALYIPGLTPQKLRNDELSEAPFYRRWPYRRGFFREHDSWPEEGNSHARRHPCWRAYYSMNLRPVTSAGRLSLSAHPTEPHQLSPRPRQAGGGAIHPQRLNHGRWCGLAWPPSTSPRQEQRI
jgi:hypothetical protein